MSTTSAEYSVRYAPSFATTQGSYKLLELPPDLCSLIESGEDTRLTIRGRATDDAVLCTPVRTYALRAVTLSNTILIVGKDGAEGDDGDSSSDGLAVHDEVSQVLELVPSLPKLNRIPALLHGCEYEEGHEEDADVIEYENDEPPDVESKRARFTMDDLRGEIQASEAELAQGLRAYHVLEIDGYLRPLSPSYLTRILEALLTALVAEGYPLPPKAAPANPLMLYLESEQEIPRRILMQVLPWFGTLLDGQWTMDVPAVLRQVGLGYLMTHYSTPEPIPVFLNAWRAAVGDTFATSVDFSLLEGYYLLTPPPPTESTHIAYFPASALPTAATQLFAELFATRERWREVDIFPFLKMVTVDGKERDKLLMKYARAITDANGGVWYTARSAFV